MKTTIKQQIDAVNEARAELEMQWETNLPALNDAASTLAAVNLIGAEKILIAPELIEVVKKVLELDNEFMAHSDEFRKMREIVNRLSK